MYIFSLSVKWVSFKLIMSQFERLIISCPSAEFDFVHPQTFRWPIRIEDLSMGRAYILVVFVAFVSCFCVFVVSSCLLQFFWRFVRLMLCEIDFRSVIRLVRFGHLVRGFYRYVIYFISERPICTVLFVCFLFSLNTSFFSSRFDTDLNESGFTYSSRLYACCCFYIHLIVYLTYNLACDC